MNWSYCLCKCFKVRVPELLTKHDSYGVVYSRKIQFLDPIRHFQHKFTVLNFLTRFILMPRFSSIKDKSSSSRSSSSVTITTKA